MAPGLIRLHVHFQRLALSLQYVAEGLDDVGFSPEIPCASVTSPSAAGGIVQTRLVESTAGIRFERRQRRLRQISGLHHGMNMAGANVRRQQAPPADAYTRPGANRAPRGDARRPFGKEAGASASVPLRRGERGAGQRDCRGNCGGGPPNPAHRRADGLRNRRRSAGMSPVM